MTEDQQTRLSRRDFLKIGGVTAGALATATVVQQIGNFDILASEEEYGGFYVRRHTMDNPPYSLDEALYTRKDGVNTSFSRSMKSTMDLMVNQDKNIADKLKGSDRVAYAFNDATSSFMFDNRYFYNIEQTLHSTHKPSPYPRWIPEEDGYTIDDVTAIVKYAAKFCGASTVGITETRERYFYSRMGGPVSMAGKDFIEDPRAIQAGIIPEKMQEVLPDLIASMEPEQFKTMLVGMLEGMEPENLPDGVNPELLANMPAETLQMMAPQMMGQLEIDPSMMQGMMGSMDPATFNPTMLMPAMDIQKMAIATAEEIVFSDEVDTPSLENDRMVFPTSMNRIIAIGIEQSYEQMVYHGSTVVCGLAVGDGYSRMATTAAKVANFIRSLGYNAVAMGNNTALSVPIAIDAGLGELGRNSLLINPKYGPRLRLCKVITDLPLNVDMPISFGVTEFCEVCGKCAEQCPSGSIPEGERTYDAPDSGSPGVLNWPVDGDGCFAFWGESGIGCSNCIRVCPFTKPEGWLHEITKILIGVKSGPIDSLLLKLDDASGYGTEEGPDTDGWWNNDVFMHIKD